MPRKSKPDNDVQGAPPAVNPGTIPGIGIGELVPQPHGGAIKRGGTNPGAGRPPDAWKARMAKLADRWAQAAEAQKILDTPDHPEWMAAGRFVAEQAYGKPKDGGSESGRRVMRFLFVDETGQRAVEVTETDTGDDI